MIRPYYLMGDPLGRVRLFKGMRSIYLLTSEERPTSLGHIESSSQVNSDNRVKLLVIHVLDRFVT